MTIRSYEDFCTKKQSYRLNDYKELELVNALIWGLREAIDSSSKWLLDFDASIKGFVFGNNHLVDLPSLRPLLQSARASFATVFIPHAGPLANLDKLEAALAQLVEESYAPQLLPALAEFVMLFRTHLPRGQDDFYNSYEEDEFWPEFDEEDAASFVVSRLKKFEYLGEHLFAKCLLFPQEVTLEDFREVLSMVFLPDVVLLYPAAELAELQEKSVALEAALLIAAPNSSGDFDA